MYDRTETIAAIATPPGRGGVGIVRVSGPAVAAIAVAIAGRCPAPRHADYRPFLDAADAALDEGLVLFFPAPHSYTGEDVLELQGHGGPVVMDLILRRVLQLGARLARPGEFTARAYLNDKLDLAQAEAVADLIDAASAQAARLALNSLRGAFSERVHALVEQLTHLRMYVEAAIDFPEEEIDFLGDGHVLERVDAILATLHATQQTAQQGSLLREGIHVVIAGRPNAGKSTLLNALTGRDTAIVTDIPGTTRDVLREQIQIDGLPLFIIDTAGLRDSDDVVEQEGIRRAWSEVARADAILYLTDSADELPDADQVLLTRLGAAGPPVTVLRTKTDIRGATPVHSHSGPRTEIALSAKTGQGMDVLRDHLKALVGYRAAGEGGFMARRRHLDALAQAQTHVREGRRQLVECRAGELLAEELREAQAALSDITGEFTADDLLGHIFTQFCVGK